MPPIASGPAPAGAPSGTPSPAGTPIPAPIPASKLGKPAANTNLIKTIVIVLLTLLLIGAGLLAIYFYNEYKVASTNVEAQVDAAVLTREQEITDKLEAEFAEREKNPYSTLTGPSDYGSVSFKYPKTWSVYIARDASKGGNFEAYLHPSEVPEISNGTILALRMTISSDTFEGVSDRYKRLVQDGKLSSSIISIQGTDATRYDGQFDNNYVGSVVIFKIRDKTVTLQTDAEIYREDFTNIINTVSFNQ